jgi:hypothetical protein
MDEGPNVPLEPARCCPGTVMTPDDEEALELLELHEDAESIHAVVWGPGLEKRAPAARTWSRRCVRMG